MFDIAWSEMFVIVVVALLVIGPKDLPRVVREVGKWTAKARGMAREFQRSFDDMVRDAELDDIRKNLNDVRPSNISKTIRDAVDPDGSFDASFRLDDLDPDPVRDRGRLPPPDPQLAPNIVVTKIPPEAAVNADAGAPADLAAAQPVVVVPSADPVTTPSHQTTLHQATARESAEERLLPSTTAPRETAPHDNAERQSVDS